MKGHLSNGFTLLELLVASVLASVLMMAVLAVLGAVGRDRRLLDVESRTPRHDPLLRLLRRDLENARTMATPLARGDGGVILVGNGGMSPGGGVSTGRLARVTYHIRFLHRPAGAAGERQQKVPDAEGMLVRTQSYLDGASDGRTLQTWTEAAATGVKSFSITPASPAAQEASPTLIPSQVRVRIEFATGAVDEQWRIH